MIEPVVGFGTYTLKGKVCEMALEKAIQLGYRLIDTATHYKNFDALAKALKKHPRDHYYLISKVWHNKQTSVDLRQDLNATLEQLGTDYLDAYLIHFPNSKIPIEETLGTMEALRQEKKIRHIGLSNVTINHLKRALELNIPITWVQVEMHPYFYDSELLTFCREKSIVVQAWAPLARGRLCEDSFLTSLGKKYGKTASQVAIRWIIQHGCVPLPGSKNERHIRENIEVLDFCLSREEMDQIDQRAKAGIRERFTREYVGFRDEFDFSYEECWPKKQ